MRSRLRWLETGAAGFARRVERPTRRVHPVQHRQHVRGHGLHAERHPREPRRPQLLEQLRRCGLRIRLRRHLRVRRQREMRAQRIQHCGQPVTAQQRGRPASDEHGVDRRWSRSAGDIRAGRAEPRRRHAEFGAQGLEPSVGVGAAQLGGRVGVEVAVAAARRTERHMDIDAERPAWHGSQGGKLHGSRSDRHTASFPDATFAHRERKSPPVRAGAGVRGTIGSVTAARSFQHRVALVARRHVDFKRVCTCCCLP